MSHLLDAALAWRAAGLAVVPARTDGTKAPAAFWKQYQHDAPGATQLHAWFSGDTYDGLGAITGAVSGHLEMLELEGRAASLAADLTQMLNDNGFGDLWKRITTGYLETSPSGGYHWLYRVADGPATGSTKLARRPSTPDELAAHVAALRADAERETDPQVRAKRLAAAAKITRGEQVPQVLIETRGEGGFTVLAPSAGRTHPTGKAWTALIGTPATIPTITVAERDALFAICSTFDTMPTVTAPATQPRTGAPAPSDGVRPGDDYNARATWDEILTPYGWTRSTKIGKGFGWTRPGKSPRDGISATTGQNDADNLYVFSSSTEFETERAYSKFGAYALLEHGGDHSAAAKALAADGYGHRAEQPRPGADLAGLLAPTADGHAPPPAAPTRHLRVVEPTTYTETDDGNALRLIDAHEGLIRYCPQRGSWLTWDGHRWRWDEANAVRELARDVARGLPDADKDSRRHRAVSLSRRGIEAMTALAQSDARAVTHLAELDARPFELNTPTGVVDLRTGSLTTPDPASLHTRSTAVAPDFDATPTRWLQFLADTFAGDPELTTYIQRLLGISLVGQVLEQLLPFAHGPGANGKTTLAGVIQRIVGIGDQGYSISAPAELLLATHQQGHPTEIARLAGARLVITSELEDGQNFAEAKIKMLTGRDTITGRFMRQDWFSFTPTHTLWLLANHRPSVRAGGPAFWRRLRLLPFEHTVPPEKRIPDLEDRLVDDEGPAILGWVLRGAADYFAHGLAEPASVRAATDAYATDQDTVGRFVAEMCTTGDPNAQHLQVKVATLRQAYESWCRVEGEQPVTAKALTTTLHSAFGVQAGRTNAARYYSGIRLNDVDETDENLSRDGSERHQQEGW